jgi:hypothetical protein
LNPNYNYGALSGKSDVTLNGPGKFVFSTINFSANTDIKINNSSSDPILIYVTGNIDLSGNAELGIKYINSEPILKPGKVQIYCTGTAGVKIHGNPDGAFALYAPNSDITFCGSSNLYGALVGKTINVNGSGDIYYDTQLNSMCAEGAMSAGARLRF